MATTKTSGPTKPPLRGTAKADIAAPRKASVRVAASREAKTRNAEWKVFRTSILEDGPSARIRIIRAGASSITLLGAAETMGVSRELIFKLVGLPASTANRKIARQATLDAPATERLARLVQIEAQAEVTFGDPDMAREWMRTVNVGLGNCTPLSMLDTDVGAREVARVLVAIAYGGVV